MFQTKVEDDVIFRLLILVSHVFPRFVVAVDAMTKMSEIGSNYDKIVSETDAHGLLCLAAQQALEVKFHVHTDGRHMRTIV